MSALRRFGIYGPLAMVIALLVGVSAQAALPIDVEVVTETGGPITAPQQWGQILGKMELGRVRIRPAGPGDKTSVKQDGQRFKVVAILNGKGDLLVDGRRYRDSDRAKLSDYFQSLAKEESYGQQKGIFGLTEKQFRAVYGELSRSVDFSTDRESPVSLLDQFAETVSIPIKVEVEAVRLMKKSKPVEWQLRGMSTGTALAIILRESNLVLRPVKPQGQPPELVIELDRPNVESWPIGWKIQGSPRIAAPKMYEFLTIEVAGYTLQQALDALEPRMGIPLIYDRRTLTRRKIKPAEIKVKLPAGRTYLKKVFDRLLSQGRLAAELRADERDQVFCWITQYGKDSPKAY